MSATIQVITIQVADESDKMAFIRPIDSSIVDDTELAIAIIKRAFDETNEQVMHDPATDQDKVREMKAGSFYRLKQEAVSEVSKFLGSNAVDASFSGTIYDNYDKAYYIDATLTRLPVGNR